MTDELRAGRIIDDRYLLTREIGAGGFGVVFAAKQITTGQQVALKVLLPQARADAGAIAQERARFEREMKLIGKLRHPNIVRLIDSGTLASGQLYMVLEFVDGADLTELVAREGRISAEEGCRLMLQVLDALSCAHELGVVHRDLKPANIMVTRSGVRRNAVVLDFGVAGIMEEARDGDFAQLTGDGTAVGTPAFIAPEQLRGEPPTPASDIYAWGLSFIQALTGEQPMDGLSVAEIFYARLSEDPIEIPASIQYPSLRYILARATAKKVEERYTSAHEAHADLERAWSEEVRVHAERDDAIATGVFDRSADPATGQLAPPAPKPAPWTAEAQIATGVLPAKPAQSDGRDVGPSDQPVDAPAAHGGGGSPRSGMLLVFAGVTFFALVLLAVVFFLVVRTVKDDEEGGSAEATEQAGGNGDAPTPAPANPDATAQGEGGATAQNPTHPELPEDATPEQIASACESGAPKACTALGTLQARREDDGEELEGDPALAAYERGCELGDASGCANAAARHETAHGAKADPKKAVGMYVRACELDNAEACGRVGVLLDAGAGQADGLGEPITYFAKACDLGHPAGCGLAGLYWEGASGAHPHYPRAATFFDRGCTIGDQAACARYGGMLLVGRGMPKDVERGLKLVDAACAAGQPDGCFIAGSARLDAAGQPTDPALVLQSLGTACELGTADACRVLGELYRDGRGVAQDGAEAERLFRLACNGGSQEACGAL